MKKNYYKICNNGSSDFVHETHGRIKLSILNENE